MHKEILFASYFLNFYIRTVYPSIRIPASTRLKLKSEIKRLMKICYQDRWFPDDPQKDSEYRCFSNDNQNLDFIFREACKKVNLCPEIIHWASLVDFSMWVDPKSITLQYGKNTEKYKLYIEGKETSENIDRAHLKLTRAIFDFNKWRTLRRNKIKRKHNA